MLIFQGDAGDDQILGGDGLDDASGGPGADLINSQARGALVSYRHARRGPVRADLATGSVMGADGSDQLRAVSGLWGTSQADTILGSRADEVFIGDRGDDVLRGRGGKDTLWAPKARTGSAAVLDVTGARASG